MSTLVAINNTVEGHILETTGPVFAERNGERIELKVNDPIYESDVIITAENTTTDILYRDGTKSRVAPNTQFTLTDYEFGTGDDGNSFLMDLTHGAVRTATGEIVKLNPEGFEIITPRATVGIRGTETMNEVDPVTNSETHAVLFISGGSIMLVTGVNGETVSLDSPLQVTRFNAATNSLGEVENISLGQMETVLQAIAPTLSLNIPQTASEQGQWGSVQIIQTDEEDEEEVSAEEAAEAAEEAEQAAAAAAAAAEEAQAAADAAAAEADAAEAAAAQEAANAAAAEALAAAAEADALAAEAARLALEEENAAEATPTIVIVTDSDEQISNVVLDALAEAGYDVVVTTPSDTDDDLNQLQASVEDSFLPPDILGVDGEQGSDDLAGALIDYENLLFTRYTGDGPFMMNGKVYDLASLSSSTENFYLQGFEFQGVAVDGDGAASLSTPIDVNLGSGGDIVSLGANYSPAARSLTGFTDIAGHTYEEFDFDGALPTLVVRVNVLNTNMDLGAGNDTIYASIPSNSYPENDFSLLFSDVNMGAGDDIVHLNNNVLGTSIELGEGNDRLTIFGDVLSSKTDAFEDTSLPFQSSITTGGGTDTVIINGDLATGAQITASSGTNYITINGKLEGNVTFGSGTNRLEVTTGSVNATNLTFGTGNDTLIADQVMASTGGLNLSEGNNTFDVNTFMGTLNAGSGDDTVSIDTLNSTVNVGAGKNTVTIGNSTNASTITAGTSGTTTINIDTTSAATTVSSDGANLNLTIGKNGDANSHDLNYTGADGNDHVTVYGNLDNTSSIQLGHGANNSLIVAGSAANTAIIAGSGNDNINITSYNGIMSVGEGTNNVTFTNTTGNTTINSSDGTTTIRVDNLGGSLTVNSIDNTSQAGDAYVVLNVTGSANTDDIDVNGTMTGGTINGNAGGDSFIVDEMTGGTINGGEGEDFFNIGIMGAGASINGGEGTDVLLHNGTEWIENSGVEVQIAAGDYDISELVAEVDPDNYFASAFNLSIDSGRLDHETLTNAGGWTYDDTNGLSTSEYTAYTKNMEGHDVTLRVDRNILDNPPELPSIIGTFATFAGGTNDITSVGGTLDYSQWATETDNIVLTGDHFNSGSLTFGSGYDSFTLRGTMNGGAINSNTGDDHFSISTMLGGTINAGDGDDTLALASMSNSSSIDAGTGVDDITINGTMSGGVINGGAGSDTIEIGTISGGQANGGADDDTFTISTLSGGQIDAGEGNDGITITTLNSGQIDAGEGTNTLTIDSMAAGIINAGAGNDTVGITSLNGIASFDLGTGTNTVNIGSITGNSTISAGSTGITTVNIAGTTTGETTINSSNADLIINFNNTGAPTDSIDNIVIADNFAKGTINLGAGNDEIRTANVSGGIVNGGADNDNFSISNTMTGGEIDGGAGNDLFTAKTATGGIIDGGDGTDIAMYVTGGLTMNNVEVQMQMQTADGKFDPGSIYNHSMIANIFGVTIVEGDKVTLSSDWRYVEEVNGRFSYTHTDGHTLSLDKNAAADTSPVAIDINFDKFDGTALLTVDTDVASPTYGDVTSSNPISPTLDTWDDGSKPVYLDGYEILNTTNPITITTGSGADRFALGALSYNSSNDTFSTDGTPYAGYTNLNSQSDNDYNSEKIGNSILYNTTLNTGAGNDIIRLDTHFSGVDSNSGEEAALTNSVINMGEGNDELYVNTSRNEVSLYKSNIDMGAGDDTVSFTNPGSWSNKGFLFGDGNNTISLGAGADNLTIDVNHEIRNYIIDGGEDVDTINIAGYIYDSEIKGGAGDDTITLGTLDNTTIVIDGGTDTININGAGSVTFDTQAASGSFTATFNNDHANTVTVNNTLSTNSTINTGAGNDSITVGTMSGGTLSGGDGNDTFTITNFTGGDIEVGEGNDTVLIENFDTTTGTFHDGNGDDIYVIKETDSSDQISIQEPYSGNSQGVDILFYRYVAGQSNPTISSVYGAKFEVQITTTNSTFIDFATNTYDHTYFAGIGVTINVDDKVELSTDWVYDANTSDPSGAYYGYKYNKNGVELDLKLESSAAAEDPTATTNITFDTFNGVSAANNLGTITYSEYSTWSTSTKDFNISGKEVHGNTTALELGSGNDRFTLGATYDGTNYVDQQYNTYTTPTGQPAIDLENNGSSYNIKYATGNRLTLDMGDGADYFYVNADFSGMTLTNPTDYTSLLKDSTINMGAGDDFVILNYSPANGQSENYGVIYNLLIEGGLGNDDITIDSKNDMFAGNLKIHNTNIYLEEQSSGNSQTSTNNLVVSNDYTLINSNILGAGGADSIIIDGTFSGSASKGEIFTYAGNDEIRITTLSGGTINLGDGVDALTITTSSQATIDTGNDADTITITTSANDTITTGAGNDILIVSTSANNSNINTGEGDDTLTLSDINRSTVDGGEGDDKLTFNPGAGTSSSVINGGMGNDILMFKSSINSFDGEDRTQVDGGADNDVLVFTQDFNANSDVKGGDGIDFLIHAQNSVNSSSTISDDIEIQLNLNNGGSAYFDSTLINELSALSSFEEYLAKFGLSFDGTNITFNTPADWTKEINPAGTHNTYTNAAGDELLIATAHDANSGVSLATALNASFTKYTDSANTFTDLVTPTTTYTTAQMESQTGGVYLQGFQIATNLSTNSGNDVVVLGAAMNTATGNIVDVAGADQVLSGDVASAIYAYLDADVSMNAGDDSFYLNADFSEIDASKTAYMLYGSKIDTGDGHDTVTLKLTAMNSANSVVVIDTNSSISTGDGDDYVSLIADPSITSLQYIDGDISLGNGSNTFITEGNFVIRSEISDSGEQLGNTTINLSNLGATGKISTGIGNDRITVDTMENSSGASGGIFTGSGDDYVNVLNLQNSTADSITIETGSGDDFVIANTVGSSNMANLSGNLGDGDDILVITNATDLDASGILLADDSASGSDGFDILIGNQYYAVRTNNTLGVDWESNGYEMYVGISDEASIDINSIENADDLYSVLGIRTIEGSGGARTETVQLDVTKWAVGDGSVAAAGTYTFIGADASKVVLHYFDGATMPTFELTDFSNTNILP